MKALVCLSQPSVKYNNRIQHKTTAFPLTAESKRKDAKALGADEVIVSRNAEEMNAHTGSFDFILNTVAASHNLDGVRADFVKQALAADIQGELTHATQLGNRIKQLNGTVPGSFDLKMTQKTLRGKGQVSSGKRSHGSCPVSRQKPAFATKQAGNGQVRTPRQCFSSFFCGFRNSGVADV